jgi:hypothetical protein
MRWVIPAVLGVLAKQTIGYPTGGFEVAIRLANKLDFD